MTPRNLFQSDGIMVVYKPVDMTSFDVVRQVKQWLKPKKIGHGGTLDPFAEGLLILLINRGTKIADQFLDEDKTYEFTVIFGYETDTLDRTGKIVHHCSGCHIERATIEEILPKFIGEISQRVPAYAAARFQGERMYKLARRGILVEQLLKRVIVHELEIIDYRWPRVTFKARCSKGTYVRQLGADIARAVGCFGTLEHLIRIQSGPFSINDAWSLEEIKKAINAGQVEKLIIPLVDALSHLPAISANEEEIGRLKYGHIQSSLKQKAEDLTIADSTPVRILNSSQDTLLALWWPSQGETKRRQLKLLI
ncbi:MAG: tRNA pseudouridine(55) synthase TruB [Syntrophobacterales bacterium]|nr:tRNA pseudouridine(55) synthase TruB [Syntrophobacterales bacterium]